MHISHHHAVDLEIWLQRREHPSYAAVVTFRPTGSPVDESLITGELPRVVLDESRLLQHSLDHHAYGAALTAMLFADQRMREALISARSRALGAGVPLRLRLRLDADDPALHVVRWELLRDPTSPNSPFLCTNARMLFSRYLASPDATPIHRGDLSVLTALLAIAAPSDLECYGLARIDRANEIAALQPTLQSIPTTILEQTTLTTLTTALLDGPTILYLVCHGTICDGLPYLWLENDQGTTEQIAGSALIERVRGLARRPLLIVLASCQSAGQSDARSEALVALGPQLAQAGVGAVIAMHDNIAIATVQAGMPVFFTELRRHGQVDLALAAMRNVLATRGEDWWQPVLFLRLDDGKLLETPMTAPPNPVELPRAVPPLLPSAIAKEIARKQDLLDLVAEKLAFFEKQELLATDPNTKFQLKKQLTDLRAQRATIEAEISQLREKGAS
ncbi:MAG: CHAT domain-containing protein [Oscillochloris sp.]|nr:CHAT domain-containing protein [Oscillochloris sp.]